MAKKKTNDQMDLVKYTGSVPNEVNRIQISVMSDIIDRFEGLSMTYPVWSETPSQKYVTEALLNHDVRKRVAEFFVRREFAMVFDKIIPVKSLRPSETLLNKTQVYRALLEHSLDESSAGVIMELCLPLLISLGLVSNNIKHSKHVRYGFDRVTVGDIKNDVMMYEVMQAVTSAKGTGIDAKATYSKAVLGEAISESFRPIGLAILEISELAGIVDDMVKGVRANLDPTNVAGTMMGSVPADWRNHRVVSELAQNMVFVRAALSLPPSESLTLAGEGWKLDKWAPMILAAIKSSERYAWVGKSEIARHYNLFKIRDNKGKVQSCVLSRSVKAVPVAQAVFAIEDAIMPGTYNISATKDRIADVIQAAYGSADFSTDIGANLLAQVLQNGIQAGWNGHKSLYMVDADGTGADAVQLAAMMSSRLYVEIGQEGIVVDEVTESLPDSIDDENWDRIWNPRWWFVVPTKELNLDVWSGTHVGTEVITCDPSEVFMAMDEFRAADSLPARAQVLGPAAFNTRVVDFDERVIQEVKKTFRFDVVINNIEMKGTFKATDFASMRSGTYTSLVLPHFNDCVVSGLRKAFGAASLLVAQMSKSPGDSWLGGSRPDQTFFEYATRRAARELLFISQQLAPGFRKEIHDAIVERTVAQSRLSIDDSVLLRARLTQTTFAAYADIIALKFFLHIQGMDTDLWEDLIASEEMVKVCMEYGSNRVSA